MVKAYSYIRISTAAQSSGGGISRQIERSREFARDKGWELDESFNPDVGRSAFHGTNVSQGSLGHFLGAVESGEIEQGSFLLIESLDRLSRQQVVKSLSLFLNIVTSGVGIVTLADGQIFTPENLDDRALMMSLFVMSRSHDESFMKSDRSRSNWARRRKNIETEKLTAMCPAWLKLSADRKHFSPLPRESSLIVRIFDEAANGLGMYSIAKRLNEERVLPIGDSNGWHQSYIAKILRNRAVLGEFQPHHRVNGKLEAASEVILDYYPRVIDDDLFLRAEAAIKSRTTKGAGRKGPTLSNLFSGILHCWYCGGRVRFENKGSGPKGGHYLVCDAGSRGHDCSAKRWRYDEFEASFLAFVEELDLGAMFASTKPDQKRKQLQDEIEATKAALEQIDVRQSNIDALLNVPKFNAELVVRQLNECAAEKEFNVTALAELEAKLGEQDALISTFYNTKGQLSDMLVSMKSASSQAFKDRAQISARLKQVVRTVWVATEGDQQRPDVDSAATDQQGSDQSVKDGRSDNPFRELRFFWVSLMDGTARTIYPSDDDPLEVTLQLMHARDENLRAMTANRSVTQL